MTSLREGALHEVQGNGVSRNQTLDRERIREIIEEPLVQAIEIFYQKGIRTFFYFSK